MGRGRQVRASRLEKEIGAERAIGSRGVEGTSGPCIGAEGETLKLGVAAGLHGAGGHECHHGQEFGTKPMDGARYMVKVRMGKIIGNEKKRRG